MCTRLKSCLCTQEQLESAVFRRWARKLGQRFTFHRKLWEWCYIVQALHERDLLRPGCRGLGFGVGREPLPALFAGRGCAVVATDMDERAASAAGWADTNQHAANRQALDNPGLCPPGTFDRLVSFRPVDMNDIPRDLRGFDFTWSSCSLEHLGSIRQGQAFLTNMMDCLRPGGVAVHTTEFNLSSRTKTLDHLPTVLFRKCDVEDLAAGLCRAGHRLRLDFSTGSRVADGFIDVPPYSAALHLKLQFGSFVTTSIGLLIEKAQAPPEPAHPGRLSDRLCKLLDRYRGWRVRRGRDRWGWEHQTSAERALAQGLVGRRFLYRRVGQGQRFLTLAAGGLVGEGAADLERRWSMRTRHGPPTLIIAGEQGPTMYLEQDADRVWRGAWLAHECSPVELIPEEDVSLHLADSFLEHQLSPGSSG